MNEERRKLRERREAINLRAEGLRKSIDAFSIKLREFGASEGEIFAALRNEREMLAKIYSEDYPNIEAAEKKWLHVERLRGFTSFTYDLEAVGLEHVFARAERFLQIEMNARERFSPEFAFSQPVGISISLNQSSMFAHNLCAA